MKQLFRLFRGVPRPVLAASAALAVLTGVLFGVVVGGDSGDGKRLKVTAGPPSTTTTIAVSVLGGGLGDDLAAGPQVGLPAPSSPTPGRPTTTVGSTGTTANPTTTTTTGGVTSTTTTPSSTTSTTPPSGPTPIEYPDGPADVLVKESVFLVRVADAVPHKVAGIEKLFDRAELSGDGRRFAYGVNNTGRDVYSARVDGSDTDLIGTGGIEAPTWSAKGDLAVIDYANGHDLVIHRASGATVRVTQAQVGPVSGREWSPDGTRIALIAGQRVWVGQADGTGVTAITPAGKAWRWLRWSPDGTRLAYFEADRLWVVPADGSGAPLDLAPVNADPSFDWSPDGTKLVLCAPFGSAPRLGIGIVPAAGGAVTPLDVQGNEVAWSPDGATIAFKGYPFVNGSPTLGAVNPDGTGARTLLTAPSGAVFGLGLDWSPDSSHLLVNTGFSGLGGVDQPF